MTRSGLSRPSSGPKGPFRVDTTGKSIDEVVEINEDGKGAFGTSEEQEDMIEVIKTKHIGFCFGVNRAVSAVLREAERSKERIYTLGPLLHNPQMVENAEGKGHRARGRRIVRRIGGRGLQVPRDHERTRKSTYAQRVFSFIDTTCPFVKRVRRHALYLRKNGYKVVIAGDRAPSGSKKCVELFGQ